MTSPAYASFSQRLAALADDPQREFDWPADGLGLAAELGWRGWCIPARYGGRPPAPAELLECYAALGAGDLSTALIVTQHDAAVDLIANGDNEALKQRLLPRFASGEIQATVGISQLTTSHQSGPPAMRVAADAGASSVHREREATGDGWRLGGLMPWVTAPQRCAHIVTGGVLRDGSQLLACVPTDRQGLRIDPPLRMLGLNASWTAPVRCEDVRVEPADVIRGPVAKALSSRSTVKPLVVSSVGIGLARALLDLIRSRAGQAFADVVRTCDERYAQLRARLMEAALEPANVDSALKTELRVAVNALLARLATTGMVLAKGSGYVVGQRAQRLVREAMFMQVWSAPEDVRHGTIAAVWT